MKVRELLAELKGADPESEVILLTSPGGTPSCRPAWKASVGMRYVADTTWSGEVYGDSDDPDESDREEWNELSDKQRADSVPCVLIVPVF